MSGGAKEPHELREDTVRAAITKAGTDPAGALTVEVFKALAALKPKPETAGLYLTLVADLVDANKKVLRRTVIEAAVAEYLPKGQTDRTDTTPDELRDGIEAWGETVDGAALVAELVALIERHCVLPKGAAVAIALWVLAAYAIDSFRIFPKLLLHSPQKRCGKTTLLELLAAVMPKPLTGSNVTPSVIFRAIELWQVSLLLDEVDTFIHGNDDMRGIVNSGHTRSTAYVWRVEGDTVREPVRFSTWAPMVLAMIGNPPSTIFDRAVVVPLERKTKDDKVVRLPRGLVEDCETMRRQCQQWANDHAAALAAADPIMPASSNDRAVDNWSALVAVADALGGPWPKRSRDAFRSLLSSAPTDEDDLSIELLRDLADILADRPNDKVFPSSLLVARLNAMDERPWPTIAQGRELTAHRLGRLLAPYRITSGSVRLAGVSSTSKGYKRETIEGAVARYLPPDPPAETGTPAQASGNAGASDCQTGTDEVVVPVADQLRARRGAGCAGVPLSQGDAANVDVSRELSKAVL